ncbi:MAG: pilus assembly PilX N-terminal domain-containing protein [Candidatus Omnitrophota bacterium]
MRQNKGFALIQAIIIITLLSIVSLGISVYISESLRLNLALINQDKALYMAQAGIMRAIVDYRPDTLWDAAQNINVSGEFYYHLGEDSNFLWVDASSPQASGKNLKRIALKNANAASSITITDIILAWTFGGDITKVTLGNTTVWTGTVSSPASLNINDLSIASGVSYAGANDQVFQFSNNVSDEVVCTFIFSDGSTFKTYLLKSGLGANREFSITATGEIRNGPVVEARRTLSATYDTGTDRITSWQEPAGHIIP